MQQKKKGCASRSSFLWIGKTDLGTDKVNNRCHTFPCPSFPGLIAYPKHIRPKCRQLGSFLKQRSIFVIHYSPPKITYALSVLSGSIYSPESNGHRQRATGTGIPEKQSVRGLRHFHFLFCHRSRVHANYPSN